MKNGRVISGSYLGGTTTAVRFAVGDQVQTIRIADKQQRFCEVIDSFRKETMRVANEPNPIVRVPARKPDPYDFEDRIVALIGTSGGFDRWHGTTRFHVEGQWVIVSFFPDCKDLPQPIEFPTASHLVLELQLAPPTPASAIGVLPKIQLPRCRRPGIWRNSIWPT